MTRDARISEYDKLTTEFQASYKSLSDRLRLLGFFRLLVFVLCIGLAYKAIADQQATLGIATAICFVLFLILVKYAADLKKKTDYTKERLGLCSREGHFLRNVDATAFSDGKLFEQPGHLYAADIDIFGPASLYQSLNRCITASGEEALATELATPSLTLDKLLVKQQAVTELADQMEWRHDFLAAGKIEESDKVEAPSSKGWEAWLQAENHFYGKTWAKIGSILVPILSIAILIWVALYPQYINYLFIWGAVQLGIVARQLSHSNRQHNIVSSKLAQLKQLSKLAAKAEEANFSSEGFQEIKSVLISGNGSASKEINRLAVIVNAFDARLNLPLAILLNGLFFWDIQCMLMLEKWRGKNQSNFPEWLSALGKLDAYCSLANLRYNEPDFSTPDLDVEPYIFEGKSLGHPLLSPKSRVCNDFELEGAGNLAIVTGANMAGKSTFLRTVGTNLVLAFAGAPVCAEKLRCAPIQLFSSMRTSDSLEEGKSYFHAELSRLQQMILLLRKGTPLFIMLDEMLKGTNSRDKQEGSIALTRQLTRLGATGLIATHDLALGDLAAEFPGKVINHCFEVFTEDDRMWFDYTLREGVCQNLNATYLMRQMGIMEEEEV